MGKHRDTEVNLKRVEFLVLLVLADGENHGYRIVQEITNRTDGRVRVLPGNLYGVINRLEKLGFLSETPRRPAPDVDDKRRRYYRITPLGKRALAEEAELLRSLVLAAETRDLIPERGLCRSRRHASQPGDHR